MKTVISDSYSNTGPIFSSIFAYNCRTQDVDKGSKNKNFTVSLLGDRISKIIAPYCDMVVDLAENTYCYNSQPK